MSITHHSPQKDLFWSPEALFALVRPMLSKTILDRAAFTLFALFLIAMAAIGLKKPEYNWDMAPYIAAAIQTEGGSVQALHKKTWGMIEQRASDNQVYKLQAGNPYNLHLYENPDDFYSMLPMYEVKIAYISAVRFLGKIANPVDATIWISVLSAIAFGGLCLVWMQRGQFVQAAPIVISVLLLAGFFYMPRIATPDLMFAAFCLGGIYLLLRDYDIAALPFLYVAFLVRPDNIIFLFALILAAIAFNQRKTGLFVLFGAALATYFWITSGNNHPGWWAHFYFSNVEIQNTMTGFNPEFSVTDYFKGIARGISVALQNNNWPKLMIVLLFAWGMLARAGNAPGRKGTAMLFAIILCFGGKFITFPLPDDRTYFVFVVAFAMILLEAWKPRLDLSPNA